MSDGFHGPIDGIWMMRNGSMEDMGLMMESLEIYYGPSLMATFLDGIRQLPANSAERLALAQECFGRDGQQILMLCEQTALV